MKNKQWHFNHKNLFENSHAINDQSFLNISKNNLDYSNNFNKLILPNPKKIFKNRNNLLSFEQNTFLSSQDYFIKNKIITTINNCKCFCHESNSRVLRNLLKSQNGLKCNCLCHINDEIWNLGNYPYIHFFSSKNQEIRNHHGIKLSRSVDNINIDMDMRNINLINVIKKLNRQYFDLKQQLKNIELDEQERNNYIQQLEDKITLLSKISSDEKNYIKSNFNYPKEYFQYRNRSSDDSKINDNDDYYNRYNYNYNILDKTKNVLNDIPFINFSNNNSNNSIYKNNFHSLSNIYDNNNEYITSKYKKDRNYKKNNGYENIYDNFNSMM